MPISLDTLKGFKLDRVLSESEPSTYESGHGADAKALYPDLFLYSATWMMRLRYCICNVQYYPQKKQKE